MVNAGRACYMGMGVRMPKYLTIYYRSTGSLHENMIICQGNLGEFSGKNCPTSIAINQLAVKITRRSLSFGCICINSSTCFLMCFQHLVYFTSRVFRTCENLRCAWDIQQRTRRKRPIRSYRAFFVGNQSFKMAEPVPKDLPTAVAQSDIAVSSFYKV